MHGQPHIRFLRVSLGVFGEEKFLVLFGIRILELPANYRKSLYQRYFVDITLESCLSSWNTSHIHT